MKNWELYLIRILAIILLIKSILGIPFVIYTEYLTRPWLIGVHYIPIFEFSQEMFRITIVIVYNIFYIVSTILFLSNYTKGYIFLLYTVLFHVISYYYLIFTEYHYLFVLHNSTVPLIISGLFFSTVIFLLVRLKYKLKKLHNITIIEK